MRPSALIGLAIAIATGAALAAPVGALEVTDGRHSERLALDDGEPYTYSYIQSIYGVLVTEEHQRVDGDLRVVRVRSSDIRAVEYFRWDGPIRRDGGDYVQDAPPYEVPQLVIRITAPYAQTIRTASRSVDLPARFGETAVTLHLIRLPRIQTLLGRP